MHTLMCIGVQLIEWQRTTKGEGIKIWIEIMWLHFAPLMSSPQKLTKWFLTFRLLRTQLCNMYVDGGHRNWQEVCQLIGRMSKQFFEHIIFCQSFIVNGALKSPHESKLITMRLTGEIIITLFYARLRNQMANSEVSLCYYTWCDSVFSHTSVNYCWIKH